MILYSEEIVVIFEYFIHNKRYKEDNWSYKCVLALMHWVTKFAIFQRLIINSHTAFKYFFSINIHYNCRCDLCKFTVNAVTAIVYVHVMNMCKLTLHGMCKVNIGLVIDHQQTFGKNVMGIVNYVSTPLVIMIYMYNTLCGVCQCILCSVCYLYDYKEDNDSIDHVITGNPFHYKSLPIPVTLIN